MTARERVLGELPGTATEVARALGLTQRGAQAHLVRLLRDGIVAAAPAPSTGRPGRPGIAYSLVGEAPAPEPDRECACCERLLSPDQFFAGREGRSLCCRSCYSARPEDVTRVRRLNDTMKASARRAKTVGNLAPLLRSYVNLITRDPCAYCGGRMEVVDHIEPLSRSGQHEWDNLTPACGSCNARKSAKPLLQFLSESL